MECSFTPCPLLDCPQHQRHLGPGQCCSTCRDPPAPAGESGSGTRLGMGRGKSWGKGEWRGVGRTAGTRGWGGHLGWGEWDVGTFGDGMWGRAGWDEGGELRTQRVACGGHEYGGMWGYSMVGNIEEQGGWNTGNPWGQEGKVLGDSWEQGSYPGCFLDDNGVEFPVGQIWSPGDPCELCICQVNENLLCFIPSSLSLPQRTAPASLPPSGRPWGLAGPESPKFGGGFGNAEVSVRVFPPAGRRLRELPAHGLCGDVSLSHPHSRPVLPRLLRR